MFEPGRLCMKVAGREAGKYCVVLKRIDDRFVLVTGPQAATGVKRRKCSVTHLEPLPEKLKVETDASDTDVISALESAGVFSKYQIEKPTAEKVKAVEQARTTAMTAAAKPAEPKKEGRREAKKTEPKKEKKEGKEEKAKPKVVEAKA